MNIIDNKDEKRKYSYNPAHPHGTCADCGEEMVYNVPRLGSTGGYVHKNTGKLFCEESPYCRECGSCAESGCCPPSNCTAVKCLYGDYNIREYRSMEKEVNDYYLLLKEVLVFLSNISPECSSLTRRELSDKITKTLDRCYSME